jgi:hypothetical protein
MTWRPLLPFVTLVLSALVHAEELPVRALFPNLSLDELRQTRDRPLFAINRRPPATIPVDAVPKTSDAAAAAAAAAQAELDDPRMSLLGIIMESPTPIIILRDDRKSTFLTVRSGARVGRWDIIADDAWTARLVDDRRQVTLEMFKK